MEGVLGRDPVSNVEPAYGSHSHAYTQRATFLTEPTELNTVEGNSYAYTQRAPFQPKPIELKREEGTSYPYTERAPFQPDPIESNTVEGISYPYTQRASFQTDPIEFNGEEGNSYACTQRAPSQPEPIELNGKGQLYPYTERAPRQTELSELDRDEGEFGWSAHQDEIKEEELLLELREGENLEWKDIAVRFKTELSRSITAHNLSKRYDFRRRDCDIQWICSCHGLRFRHGILFRLHQNQELARKYPGHRCRFCMKYFKEKLLVHEALCKYRDSNEI